jgi:tRNA threonylcarbamoyladenosine biosynthesis protein TsaB
MEEACRIMALETSDRHGSVAALWGHPDGVKLVGQISITAAQRTAEALAPTLKELLENAGWTPSSVNLVAVTVGPGSFTGLRIGVTTAKVFAYAVGAEVIAVNTLDVLAAQTPASNKPLWTIMDAQRQELFAAKYAIGHAGKYDMDRKTFVIAQDAWLEKLCGDVQVTGPALKRMANRLPGDVVTTPPENWQPMAEAVGQVAWHAYHVGQRDDLWQLAPNYYRASAAEEKNPL